MQVLVANKGRWLNREQITTILWPEADPETATNHFKVVLNTLNQVLEPERPAGSQPFFIQRRHEQYGLNPNALIQVDIDLYSSLIKENSHTAMEKALLLYKGHYFADEYIQEWLIPEEQYFHEQYLGLVGKFVEDCIRQDQLSKALNLAEDVLKKNHLHEPILRQVMRIQHRLGNLSAIQTAFHQFCQATQEFFGSDVSPESRALYKELLGESLE